MKGEISVRHDDVGRVLYRCALSMGLRAHLEPKYLIPASGLLPNLMFMTCCSSCQAGAS